MTLGSESALHTGDFTGENRSCPTINRCQGSIHLGRLAASREQVRLAVGGRRVGDAIAAAGVAIESS
jgi:hypothetical protein